MLVNTIKGDHYKADLFEPAFLEPPDHDYWRVLVTRKIRYDVGQTFDDFLGGQAGECADEGEKHDLCIKLIEDEAKRQGTKALFASLYMLDHSGVHFSLSSFDDPWDSGMIGFFYCLLPAGKPESQAWKELHSYFQYWKQFHEGDVYDVVFRTIDGEEVDTIGAMTLSDIEEQLKEMDKAFEDKARKIAPGELVPPNMQAWALENGYAEFDDEWNVVGMDRAKAKKFIVQMIETRVYVVEYEVEATSEYSAEQIVKAGYGEVVHEDIKDTLNQETLEVKR